MNIASQKIFAYDATEDRLWVAKHFFNSVYAYDFIPVMRSLSQKIEWAFEDSACEFGNRGGEDPERDFKGVRLSFAILDQETEFVYLSSEEFVTLARQAITHYRAIDGEHEAKASGLLDLFSFSTFTF